MRSIDSSLPAAFHWLNLTQFLGALNDNVFKLLVVFVLGSIHGPAAYTQILFRSSIIFVIPFLLFSQTAGVIADRASKSRIVLITKMMEVAIMLLGCAAIVSRHPPALYAILFLMCTQSAIFGPVKYGIIPELVTAIRLSKANGQLVGATYLAIIAGTFLPSFLTDHVWPGNHLALGFCCVGIALIGLATAWRVPLTPPAGSNKRCSWFFLREIRQTLRELAADRVLYLTVLANAYFLLLAAFIQMAAIHYGTTSLALSLEQSGYLFPVAAVGIGIGALLAGALSGSGIAFGLVPLAATGMVASCLGIGFLTPSLQTIIPMMYVAGVSAGAFVVPLSAFVQFRSPARQRGEFLACQNFLSFLGVAIAAGLFALMTGVWRFSPRACFVAIGLLTAVLTAIGLRLVPDMVVRLIGLLVTRLAFRLKVDGVEHLPAVGGALIITNHVTRLDPLLLQSVLPRRLRFLLPAESLAYPRLQPLFRLMGVIACPPPQPAEDQARALRDVRRELDGGGVACIFAEGAMTRNGHMRPFQETLETVLRDSNHPIIPAYIGGAWGSRFSHFRGHSPNGMPRQLPYPITLVFGNPMPPTATAREVQRAVEELSLRYFELKKEPRRNLVNVAVRTCRHHWRRHAFADTTGKRLTYGRALTGAVALARLLPDIAPEQRHIGILLPTTIGGLLANMAVTLTGRIPVNLNYTASRAAIQYAIDLCEIRTILTARAFLEKLEGFGTPPGAVYLEDLLPRITPARKLMALLRARWAPPSSFMTHARPGPDDVATVIFSSGSTGKPKGVMLSHHNILSNIEGFANAYRFDETDNICANLPFFHSFGFTTTLWCPLVVACAAHYHPNPRDAAGLVQLIRDQRLTMLMTTPTFLGTYMRKGTREDFASLRALFTGAEKLKTRMADACQTQLGIRPLEGYGTTELAPVVSVNIDNVTAGDQSQIGAKEGSVGHPIPGVLVNSVDPDTGQPLPPGEDGLLLCKGPNVMLGYYKEPERTHACLQDGWYQTGDIGRLDPDGFLYITDRLARFSKIGGEMVPHMAVEECLMDALGAVSDVLAITAIPDERKGEQLVLLYTPEAGDLHKLQQLVQACALPNLWKPRKENFIAVPEIPKLGSGKMDLSQIRKTATHWAHDRPGLLERTLDRLRPPH